MPGKGEPGWVLRSQEASQIGVIQWLTDNVVYRGWFHNRAWLNHTLGGSVLSYTTGSLDVSVSSFREDQARGKVKGCSSSGGRGLAIPRAWNFCSRPVLRGLYTHFPHASLSTDKNIPRDRSE